MFDLNLYDVQNLYIKNAWPTLLLNLVGIFVVIPMNSPLGGFMKIQILTAFSVFALLIVFQNCGKVDFKYTGRSLAAAESIPVTTMDTGVVNNPPSGGSESGSPGNSGSNSGNSGNSNSGGSVSGSSDGSGLVECELGGSNSKIILANNFAVGSNAQPTRICMSENACLKLINSYAQVRNCSLSLGGASSAKCSSDCTQVFPGSQGTCKNAQALSDQDVTNLLINMSI